MRQIGIIGGGASGMMAAIAAANTSIKDTEITILERRDRIGRKILATGNGKCNLGNTDFSPKRDYRSHDPYRLPEFFARFQTSDTIRSGGAGKRTSALSDGEKRLLVSL